MTWINTLLEGKLTFPGSPCRRGAGTEVPAPLYVLFSLSHFLPLGLRPDRIRLATIARIGDDEVFTLP
ncbi:MAG: hypothetical protein OEM94_10780, partial [Acidimicrobiia bacterium]|nr:hypothetical protein [Acidimicrobiia bacterium]